MEHTLMPTLDAPVLAPAPAAEPVTTPPAPPRAPLNILVVDDNPQSLLAMQAALADEDLTVLVAESGHAALELLLVHDDIVLALLDVQMPVMDGYTLAELMRGSERTRHVPIIFLTAGAREAQRMFRGYEAGAVDFLYKPVDPQVLDGKIKVFVDLHRQRQLLATKVAELERLARTNALMLAALSHDIREPLTVLMLNAEMMIRRSELPTLQKAGARMKAATTVLGRQVDHLVNLGRMPDGELKPVLARGDLARLVEQRLQVGVNQALLWVPCTFESEGDPMADFDARLVADAIDHLLLQAATHAGDAQITVYLDGTARRAIRLSLCFDLVLSDAAARYLFGAGKTVEGMTATQVGSGLQGPQDIARAHGGSLIGSSRQGHGTRFELMLPRGWSDI
ncbi:hybrid sensor histidine kinase/response regulator [Pelomonas sp. KK5]|uniref:hybrid sensor histidine kinase/response regulator n=1 Tax=Pelomonas sp. KK5 TaxID=1855730 RepID=UPI0009FA0D5C|nr:hybrid sensor histidine kinase/response regulator [Pelomonas sp. KK5]